MRMRWGLHGPTQQMYRRMDAGLAMQLATQLTSSTTSACQYISNSGATAQSVVVRCKLQAERMTTVGKENRCRNGLQHSTKGVSLDWLKDLINDFVACQLVGMPLG